MRRNHNGRSLFGCIALAPVRGARAAYCRAAGGAGEDRESGQVMVMIIGYTVICLLVVTAVMAASALYIEHKRLLALADSAAVAAADTFTLGNVSISEGVPVPILNETAVNEAVLAHLVRASASEHFDSLAIDPQTGTADGRTAHVVLSAVVHPPVVNFLIPAGVSIAVVSEARSELTR